MSDPIDFAAAKKRLRVPTSKRHVNCPMCGGTFDLKEQEGAELAMKRADLDSADDMIISLTGALKEIYAVSGDDPGVAEILESVDIDNL